MTIQIMKNLFSRITYSASSGKTFEEAIVILGAKNTKAGVDAEFKYISNIYGEENKDWDFKNQSLVYLEDKQIEEIQIEKKTGASFSIFFDITDFFGK